MRRKRKPLIPTNYWKGKLYLKIEHGSPWYSTGKKHDRCLRQLLKIGRWTLAIRCNDTTEFKDKYKEKILTVFDSIYQDRYAIKNGQTYFINDHLWILRYIDDLETTSNWQVFYNKKNNSYIGYSHRACQEFRIGDMLFEDEPLDKKTLHQFYCNKKLRWKMLKTLLKYHFKNDTYAFEDVFEDDIIGHGISLFICFKDKGKKRIETKEECFQAACNFAKYIS